MLIHSTLHTLHQFIFKFSNNRCLYCIDDSLIISQKEYFGNYLISKVWIKYRSEFV
ncbi:hypothetical protein CLOSTMETH_01816 [[Clostridium] methylpentosum DSM 5476]|uniref:Uncharacterized protein n=1 Tax=[Clostridium] methylpentosum DSM 5476 TaxID=537013 RepID=C0ED89_9FIRM|nr:hypothetical protein CLOSTMETH_01816 [[Clostridium] methylpentosum DSM 5476]